MIDVGLIGLGNHMMTQIFPNLLKLSVKITAVCDLDIRKIEQFRSFAMIERVHCYENWLELLDRERLDAVFVVGNAKLHYEVSREALIRRIKVFVEKPPCVNSAQASELKTLQEKTGCFGMVGFNRRFTTSYRMMKHILESKDFGKPYLYTAKYDSSPYPDSSFFLFNHVIHHLDLMRYLLGEIREIHADRIMITEKKTGYHIRFLSEKGVMGFLQASSFQCESYPMERVEIIGDGRSLIADNVKNLQYNRASVNKTEMIPQLLEGENTLCWNYNQGHSSMYTHYGYERELACFVEAVKGMGEPESTFVDTEKTLLLYEKLLQNITEGNSEKGWGNG